MHFYRLAMQKLFDEAAAAYSDAPQQIRVKPSIPVLYFGDYQRYINSPLRVITVALNPSNHEFPRENPFERFQSADGVSGATIPSSPKIMMALNSYFKTKPYKWFDSLEPVISGFKSSYFSTRDNTNTALHTDLLSPVATYPTWSKLEQGDRDKLAVKGIPLWHDLVRKLRPHIILISVAKPHIAAIKFLGGQRLKKVYTFSAKPNYPVQHAVVPIDSDHSADLIFARAAQMPFGFFRHEEKQLIGQRLRDVLHNKDKMP